MPEAPTAPPSSTLLTDPDRAGRQRPRAASATRPRRKRRCRQGLDRDDPQWRRFLAAAGADGIIRHIVATVDNLPRKTIAIAILPVKPAGGPFVTGTDAGGMLIASDNAARYAAYVSAAEAIDAERLAGFYVRLYPLFQQAYVELGYPNGYFNDRLIGVIDHLLAAPEPKAPVYLAQPRVVFEFTDPQLESLSAGQKILVRVGADNEMRIKAKLRELRKLLASGEVHR